MKKLLRWLLGVGAVLSGAQPVNAQANTGGQATIYPVAVQGEAARFAVPQVRLPDAAVARRINRRLLAFVTSEFSTIDSTASPRRQLQQAARECCYDEDSKTWWAGGQGLSGTSYGVLLNQNYLLSFEFSRDWQGLTEPATYHLTFNLRTGRLLTLPELVADPPAQLERRLGLAISRRLHDELAGVVASYGDSTLIAHVAQLYGLDDWNTSPQAAQRLYVGSGAAIDPSESLFYLTEFALRPDALLLFHPVGLSRLDFEFLPDETYVFPYARLQPRAILQPVVEATRDRKKAVNNHK
ncbi:hypothetical protein [Hymenobacter lucidus]|uniref:DUF3298 domain-containing protein n=1 Tax=Hymenobacter lucidus TaxID=2880930 RepID=A0ABS8AXE3_9BACT|nr:hypothetical protein [Hymenobacter lucidus]MCB2410482.1 hypothetical protein [Hymenobacter lucidus]